MLKDSNNKDLNNKMVLVLLVPLEIFVVKRVLPTLNVILRHNKQ